MKRKNENENENERRWAEEACAIDDAALAYLKREQPKGVRYFQLSSGPSILLLFAVVQRVPSLSPTSRTLVKLVTAYLLTGCASLGCSSERPPPAGDPSFTPSGGGSASGGSFASDGGSTVPLCTAPAGTFCECVDVPLFTDPPNMYFVLDRSGSMAEGNKWDDVRVTMAKILRALGPRANFGATVFPGFAKESCAAPVEIVPTRPGDPPGEDGPTTRSLLSATASSPYGGTPTAAALRMVRPTLTALGGKTFVVLATDGGPNCNAVTACGIDKCQPNIESYPGCTPEGPKNCCEAPYGYPESCLDDVESQAAVTALAQSGIPVYVVGIPGSSQYGAVLDALAQAGGTAQQGATKYYRVQSGGGDELLATLKKVAAKIVATCEYDLQSAPAAPDRVNVYLDEVVLPKDPIDGWKLEDKRVTLLGDACKRVLDGDVLGVRIVAGCPTVDPR